MNIYREVSLKKNTKFLADLLQWQENGETAMVLGAQH